MKNLFLLILCSCILWVYSQPAQAFLQVSHTNATSNQDIILFVQTSTCGLSPIIRSEPVLDGNVIRLRTNAHPLAAVISPCPNFMPREYSLSALFDLAPGSYEVVSEVFDITVSPNVHIGTETVTFSVGSDVFKITPASNGSYYDPDQSGHGIVVEFLADQRSIFYWYTFDSMGNPFWLIGVGTYQDNIATYTLFEVSGGQFPPDFDPTQIQEQEWGSLTLDFTDCRNVLMSWNAFSSQVFDGNMTLSRLSPFSGISCADDTPNSISKEFIFDFRGTEALPEPHTIVFADASEYSIDQEDTLEWSAEYEPLPDALGGAEALHITASAENGPGRIHLSRSSSLPAATNGFSPLVHPLLAMDIEVTFASKRSSLCHPWEIDVRFSDSDLRLGERPDLREEGASPLRTAFYQQSNAPHRIGLLAKPGTDEDCNSDEWAVRTIRLGDYKLLVPNNIATFSTFTLRPYSDPYCTTCTNLGLDVYIIEIKGISRSVNWPTP